MIVLEHAEDETQWKVSTLKPGRITLDQKPQNLRQESVVIFLFNQVISLYFYA